MLSLDRPRDGGARAGPSAESIRLDLLPATLLVGRSKIAPGQDEAFVALTGGGRCSRRHGLFGVDSAGVVRYVDLGSPQGSLLVPLRGGPRRVPPRRPVALWPGDAIAVGGALPAAPSAAHVRRFMHVFRVEASGGGAGAESPPRSPERTPHPALDALQCTVCHELLRGARVLACGHLFCDDCISRWFRTNATCPTCRVTCDAATVATSGSACTQVDAAVAAVADSRSRAALEEYATLTSAAAGKRKRSEAI